MSLPDWLVWLLIAMALGLWWDLGRRFE